MQKRIDKKNKEIQENLNRGMQISEILKNTDDISVKHKQLQKYKNNLNEWKKVGNELDILYEKMKKYM